MFLVPSLGGRLVARDLLHGCWCWGRRIGNVAFPPTSMAVCATLLREAGIRADVHDETVQGPCRDLNNYDFLAVLTSSLTFEEDARAIATLRAGERRATTVWFGAHPTFRPRQCLAHDAVDWVVLGEPEVALLEFFRSGAAEGVHGKELRDEAAPPRRAASLEDLDSLPITDRTLLPSWKQYPNPLLRGPYITYTTSRGCSSRCTFCTAPGLYGRRYRAQSPRRVLAELEAVVSQGCRSVFFRDENFVQDRDRVLALCELLTGRDLRIEWVCSARVDQVDGELIGAMGRAGCRLIRFGVETGSQRLLDLLGKGTTVEQARQAFRWCREARVRTHAHFMLGLPGETDEELGATLALSRTLGASYATFGAFTYLPGALAESAAGYGSHRRRMLAEDGMAAATEGREEANASLRDAQLRAYRQFYLRPSVVCREALRLLVGLGSVRSIRSAWSVAAMMRPASRPRDTRVQKTM